MRWLLALLLLMLPLAVLAQQPLHDPQPLQFRDGAEERRFHDLAAQLRCVQCQNQSLADSNAQIAQDLRREVLQLMQQGRWPLAPMAAGRGHKQILFLPLALEALAAAFEQLLKLAAESAEAGLQARGLQ